MEDEPAPLGPEIDALLHQVLPDHIAAERVRYLKEHADEVLALRQTAKWAWEQMLAHEVGIMLFDGLSPRLAEQAARNNLGVRKAELDEELEVALERESDKLMWRIVRLLEIEMEE